MIRQLIKDLKEHGFCIKKNEFKKQYNKFYIKGYLENNCLGWAFVINENNYDKWGCSHSVDEMIDDILNLLDEHNKFSDSDYWKWFKDELAKSKNVKSLL